MTTTNNLALTLVEASQAQKEVTVNEALSRIDAVLNTGVKDKDLSTPPGSPAEGDVYIVGASATGDWASHEDELAYFNQVWRFIAPKEGLTLWVGDEEKHYTYDGTNWIAAGGLQAAVTAYGATGDGSTDDTTAIQDAVDAVSAAGGGVIFFPAGTYKTTSAIDVPAKCILRGAARVATVLDIEHTGHGITLTGSYSGVESLKVAQRDSGTVGSGIRITANKTHLRDLQCAGGVATSWAIDVDHANICLIENVDIGGDGADALSGNGIVFRNSDVGSYAYNYGDALLSKVDVQLGANNTTGIKCAGPDSSSNKINNLLLSQVEVTGGAGGLTGDIGIHIYNASRITLHHVDLENLSTAVKHEGAQNSGALSESCVFLGVFVLGTTTAYSQNGTVTKTTFMGCDNFPDTSFATGFQDGDAILAGGAYIVDSNGTPNVRLHNQSGTLRFDDGADDGGLDMVISGNNPQIQPIETGGGAILFLGADGIRAVHVTPQLRLPEQTSSPLGSDDGTIAYCDGTGWDPMGDGYEGFVGRVNGSWVKLHA